MELLNIVCGLGLIKPQTSYRSFCNSNPAPLRGDGELQITLLIFELGRKQTLPDRRSEQQTDCSEALMESYDKLKAVIKEISPRLFHPMTTCPECRGKAPRYDKKRETFFNPPCPHDFKAEMIPPDTIQLMNVLETLWTVAWTVGADTDLDFSINNNDEFTRRSEFNGDYVAMNLFWNRADDNLDHQSDDVKQFLIDYLINDTRNALFLEAVIEERDRPVGFPEEALLANCGNPEDGWVSINAAKVTEAQKRKGKLLEIITSILKRARG
jgi:hypothetical protein